MVTLVEEYPVGTVFLKSFLGYGVWEGQITAFDGKEYDVVYQEDGYIESFDCDEMDDIIAKSDRLRAKNVKVAAMQTAGRTAAAAVKTGDGEKGLVVPSHSKRERKQTVTYAEEMTKRMKKEEPIERTEEWTTLAKEEELQGGGDNAKKLPASPRRSSKTFHYHEGFKFHLHHANVRLPYDIYQCSSYSKSIRCPMKLRLYRETGSTEAYATFGESIDHCDQCKRKNGKAPPIPPVVSIVSKTACGHEAEEALSREARERSAAFLRRPQGGWGSKSTLKREAALRGWETRRNKTASSSSGHAGIKRALEDSNPINFDEGAHVWVRIGKTTHPAVIESLHDDEDGTRMARVRWATAGTSDEVEVDQLSLMFAEGESATSPQRKRKRKETDRFKPPQQQQQHRKRVKMQEAPIKEDVVPAKEKKKNTDMLTKSARRAVKEESSAFVRENLHAFNKVPSGLAPGPGWTSQVVVVGRDLGRNRRWISPDKGIVFKFPRAAFEFEGYRQRFDSDEERALDEYVQAKKAAGEGDNIASRGSLSRKTPTGLAPGPGWKSKMPSNHRQRQWISPAKGIVFSTPRAAFQFEGFRQQCSGDEERALGEYVKAKKAAGERHLIANRGKLSRRTTVVKRQTWARREVVSSKTTTSKVKLQEQQSSEDEEEDGEELEEESEPDEELSLEQMAELNTLWTYYLKPSTREDEELPSGIVLRKREAACNLLRFKDSVFRQKAHAHVLRLERRGKKAEILRILKAMHKHDISMDCGDGPPQLLEEILGRDPLHDDVEVLDAAAVAALQAGNSDKAKDARAAEGSKTPADSKPCSRRKGTLNDGETSRKDSECDDRDIGFLDAQMNAISPSDMEEGPIDLIGDEEEQEQNRPGEVVERKRSAVVATTGDQKLAHPSTGDEKSRTSIDQGDDAVPEPDHKPMRAQPTVPGDSVWTEDSATTSATSASSTAADDDCGTEDISNNISGEGGSAASAQGTRKEEVIDLCGDDDAADQGPAFVDLSQIDDMPAAKSNEVIVLD